MGISSHTSLAGLVLLAGTWHWAFWDLDMFVLKQVLSLDLLRVFGIHLVLASSACFSFGYSHLTGALGPGFWTTDAFGLVGQVRGLKPSFAMTTLSTDSFGSLATHHLAAGCLGCFAGLWHSSALPGPTVAVAFSVSSIESALAASLPPMGLTASMVSTPFGSTTTSAPIQPKHFGFWSLSFDSLHRLQTSQRWSLQIRACRQQRWHCPVLAWSCGVSGPNWEQPHCSSYANILRDISGHPCRSGWRGSSRSCLSTS